jgi:2-polyprenyl-6-methoxyphenol hydroxylase-like FAD-dependent oxidoreductase
MRKFAIVGGGIGGLTLAIALQRKGFDVTVYESAPELKPLGAGIVLAANAIKAYQQIGIADAILEKGYRLKLLRIKNQRGQTLSETNADEFSLKHGGINNFAIHRAELHRVLLQHLQPGTLQTAKNCIDFTHDAKGIRLVFSDNTSVHVPYVIACDGIHSVIRKKLIPTSIPRFAGYTCWRAIITDCPEGFDVTENSETWGAAGRFGIVPLGKNSIYWFACINTTANDPIMRSFKTSDLLAYFKNFANPIPDIIRRTRDEQLISNDIIDLKPLKQFSFNNLVLLGDAAHATTPNMGQGACMAIEDAVVLANCLGKYELVQEAFKQYEARRIARTTRIVNTSWHLGKIAQLENPLLIGLRNAALRLTPQRVAENQLKFIFDISFD